MTMGTSSSLLDKAFQIQLAWRGILYSPVRNSSLREATTFLNKLWQNCALVVIWSLFYIFHQRKNFNNIVKNHFKTQTKDQAW